MAEATATVVSAEAVVPVTEQTNLELIKNLQAEVKELKHDLLKTIMSVQGIFNSFKEFARYTGKYNSDNSDSDYSDYSDS